jgi:hypothetical protein
MASVTVGGGSGGISSSAVVVTTLQNTNVLAGQVAAAALGTITNTASASALVLSGNETVASPLSNSTTAVLVENTAPTTLSNQIGASGQTIFTGTGGMTFSDYGVSDTIIAGGWINNITFETTSSNGVFLGDGINTITVASTVSGGQSPTVIQGTSTVAGTTVVGAVTVGSGGAATVAAGNTVIVGTASSVDTVTGTTVSGSGIYYQSALGAEAFIDPGAHNATVVGTLGGTEVVSVFGGTVGTAFTGSLTVYNGDGYFQGGSAGDNVMGSSTIGSTTMIGGGAGDTITSNGYGDRLVSGLGAETLQSANSVGGVSFYASVGGTTSIYMHSASVGTFGGNSVVGGNPGLKGWTSGAEKATVYDFISGTDKLVLYSSVTGGSPVITTGTTVVGGTSEAYSVVTTANGSTFTFLGTTIHSSDIISR